MSLFVGEYDVVFLCIGEMNEKDFNLGKWWKPEKVSMVVNEVNSDICILSVKTQKEANSVIINNDVDLFIIEINSNNDSFEFAKDVRKQRAYRFIPVVIMADNEKLIFQAYEIVRCYAFMKKPYDMEGLKEILKKLNNYKFVKRKSDKVI